ncbi:ATP-dependent nuclease [Bradyrhizobium prioriisuperbiae]|uniref:ATP-dependent nuclease n=1 Tax=Bradyrhizobium prioriisuperbiae TaxID=2854389 RepID=UPI0028E45C98|nr:AAA family ATPase [Bradyrhizobium prioritasuperba]
MKLAQVQDYKRRLEASAHGWPIRLERFEFENIPSVGSGELPFPSPIVVLAGPNGVGKTTLLRALWAAAAPALAHDDPSTKLKLSVGKGTLSYVQDSVSKTSVATFTQGIVKVDGDAGVATDVIHLDSSDESKRQQINFCAFNEVEDLINGVGHRTLDAKSLEEINYISRRDYREVKVYEIENDGSPLPFFEVSYGNERYDSRTMGAGEVALFFLWWSIDRASDNAVLLIEEPETHLSPASQEALSHYLLKVAVEKRLSVVLTSHSHKIINSFSEGQLVFLFRYGALVKTRSGLPPPALMKTIGIDPHVDVVVLVEDQLAQVFLRLMLERVRPALSRRIEISIRNGHGDITSLLKKLNDQFQKVKIIGCYDGDMRESITGDIRRLSTFLPGDKSLELHLREIVTQQPERLMNATGSDDVGVILFGLQGAENHDWYSNLCSQLGLSPAQLFPMLFGIWMQQEGNSEAAVALIAELSALID